MSEQNFALGYGTTIPTGSKEILRIKTKKSENL
jgi:hypothetical protein